MVASTGHSVEAGATEKRKFSSRLGSLSGDLAALLQENGEIGESGSTPARVAARPTRKRTRGDSDISLHLRQLRDDSKIMLWLAKALYMRIERDMVLLSSTREQGRRNRVLRRNKRRRTVHLLAGSEQSNNDKQKAPEPGEVAAAVEAAVAQAECPLNSLAMALQSSIVGSDYDVPLLLWTEGQAAKDPGNEPVNNKACRD